MTRLRFLLLAFMLLWALPAAAADAEAETARFLREAFAQSALPAVPEFLWLTAELRPAVQAILGRDISAARLRYWRVGHRTAWVLDEVGKEMPITVGIVVNDGRIERMRVLAYRESRGWEVQSPNFLRQFTGAQLGDKQQLDRNIDGISGATLSVRAMTRMAKLALRLHQETMKKVAAS
ncbi:MAG: FMN-binding protein [Rugosibacter sp.]|nr:FMN-binding protein [Rugosibacter sp.]